MITENHGRPMSTKVESMGPLYIDDMKEDSAQKTMRKIHQFSGKVESTENIYCIYVVIVVVVVLL